MTYLKDFIKNTLKSSKNIGKKVVITWWAADWIVDSFRAHWEGFFLWAKVWNDFLLYLIKFWAWINS